jgi:hypothetical protein
MHVRVCRDDEIQIPLHVGENRSRTWILTRTAEGLRLKHDHRLEDGSDDPVTQYGGDTAADGTPWPAELPRRRLHRRAHPRGGDERLEHDPGPRGAPLHLPPDPARRAPGHLRLRPGRRGRAPAGAVGVRGELTPAEGACPKGAPQPPSVVRRMIQ